MLSAVPYIPYLCGGGANPESRGNFRPWLVGDREDGPGRHVLLSGETPAADEPL